MDKVSGKQQIKEEYEEGISAEHQGEPPEGYVFIPWDKLADFFNKNLK